MSTSANLALRVNRANPDHHLWNNNGTWWCHFTVHLPDFTKRRIRRSLRTPDLGTARRNRDSLLSGWLRRATCSTSLAA
jgi:hypothetical protein